MMNTGSQTPIQADPNAPLEGATRAVVVKLLLAGSQPSAWELVQVIDKELGPKARWYLRSVLRNLATAEELRVSMRSYCDALGESDDLTGALGDETPPRKEIESSIDALLRASNVYRESRSFQEMIGFMGRFRDYAPYNNMLVHIQNPACSFYATAKDWQRRFSRFLKEDAHPMLILAPMHPVMLVYDLDQTTGPPLPKELSEFGQFSGDWNPEWLERVIKNAEVHDRIRVDFKILSSTNAGFATIAFGDAEFKLRTAIHEKLDGPSRFGVLCHELAHIYLGHLGSDKDYWWPSRRELSHHAMEIEAEATAHIVAARFGLQGSSAQYVSRHLGAGPVPSEVSMDLIAKVAGRLERMANESMGPRKSRRRAEGK